MTKQEKIEKEWIDVVGLEVYNDIRFIINGVDGATPVSFGISSGIGYDFREKDNPKKLIYEKLETHYYGVRPISLRGIENNHNWTVINAAKTNLPDDADKLYFVGTMFESGFQMRGGVLSCDGAKNVVSYENHTHFQAVNKPELPLY